MLYLHTEEETLEHARTIEDFAGKIVQDTITSGTRNEDQIRTGRYLEGNSTEKVIDKTLRRDKEIHVAFLDLEKTFDRVNKEDIWRE